VTALVRAFEMFDEYDEDGNGYIDPGEYYRISCKLFPNQQRTREDSDAEMAAIDLNGDGFISPEEWYHHCRLRLAANQETYEAALQRHQDVFMDLTRPGSFLEADKEAQRLQGTVRMASIMDGDTEVAPPSPSKALDMSKHSDKTLEIYFRRLFAIADADKSGALELEEVKELLCMSGFQLKKDVVQRIVEAADVNSDGVIQYEEFVPMMMSMLPRSKKAKKGQSAVKRLDASTYSPEVLAVYFKQLFALGDVDGSGTLSPMEVKSLLTSTGFNFTKAEVEGFIARADVNKDGVIDYAEFVPMMAAALIPSTQAEIKIGDHNPEVLDTYFRRLFALGDVDGSGVLEPSEVSELLLMSGFNLPADVVAELVEAADTNNDGVIEYDEFVPLMINMLNGSQSLQGMFV